MSMSDEDKGKIRSNLSSLVVHTKWNDQLKNLLFEKNVFTNRNMIDDITDSSSLYNKVTKRGSKAFFNLVSALLESDNLHAANLLDAKRAEEYVPPVKEVNPEVLESATNFLKKGPTAGRLSLNPTTNVKVFNPPTYENPDALRTPVEPPPISKDSTDPIKVSVKQGKEFLFNHNLGTYTMKSNPRGLALIFNMEKFSSPIYKDRTGSRFDEQNLKILFEEFGFTVQVKRDLTRAQAYNEFDKLSTNPDLKNCEMLIICILSHGQNNRIVCSDGLELQNEKILKKFNNEYCPQLRGKPKFFIFQACRGEDRDFGAKPRVEADGRVEMDAVQIPPESIQRALPEFKDPVWEDILIAYSTLPGYVSNRDLYRGTWFIESLVSVFMEKACEMELSDMLSLVARQLGGYESEKGYKQSFAHENRHFTKKLYFNPGLYE